MRAAVPDRLPLVVRVSATDWAEGGWDLEQTIELRQRLKAVGVDLIDVLQRRQRARRQDPGWPRLPGALRRGHPQGSRHPHRAPWA